MPSVPPIRRFYASLRKARERPDLPESRLALVHEPTQKALQKITGARSALENAGGAAATGATGIVAPAVRALRRIEARLQRPLRIAVIGEFNSGKSTLANLLVRIESLPTAVIPNTRIPTLLYHARAPEIFAVSPDRSRRRLRAAAPAVPPQPIFRLEVGLPVARLKAVEILDMPGLADARLDGSIADLPQHSVDIALWCTLCTQAWKESERAAWHDVAPRMRRRGFLVATHRDLLQSADVDKLLERLHDDAGPWFRGVLPLSTLEALTVTRAGHGAGAVWQASGAAALETALDDLIHSVRTERLAAALDVTARVAGRALSRIAPAAAAAARAVPAVTARRASPTIS